MWTQSKLLYDIHAIRQLEAKAITLGIDEATLMERAGKAVYEHLRSCWPDARTIAVVCGGGHNGGDGYVVARLAKQAGLNVCIYSAVPMTQLKNIDKEHYEKCVALGITIKTELPSNEVKIDVIVDALLGIGLQGAVKKSYREWIRWMNQSERPILAIDVPSGLSAQSGTVAAEAVHAHHTVTFLGYKTGLFTGAARDYCGTIWCHDLDLPSTTIQEITPKAFLASWDEYQTHFVARRPTLHKGEAGHVLIIGGDHGYGGALCLAAQAALRTGAGLVSAITHPHYATALLAVQPEIMCHSKEALNTVLPRATVIAIGPGLGKSPWSHRLIQEIFAQATCPMVLDADALNLVAEGIIKLPNVPFVLTPHPGEAARLLKSSVQTVQEDRYTASEVLQQQYGGVVVLKGAGTLIRDDQTCWVNTEGNPGMASGGMGDVLTGIIAALMAQRFSLSEAAVMGVCLHGHAADNAAKLGMRGLLASDVINELRRLVNYESL